MKMLVKTIQISFSSYAADTIRIHTGETGREIQFVPDMEISGNYSADFIVIKPDDTFVIAAATITDGKINVVIPEQAGAVAGAGHYILKIYDSGEVCIYSASGGFMVDDHLLTDSMIESVAEVYGYRFPQDFAKIDDDVTGTETTWSSEKIAEEIAGATPDIIDDNNVSYDKTWSSEKISYELGNVPSFSVYSTTEQPVGRWIDGRTIYQKTFTGIKNYDSYYAMDLNIDLVIEISGVLKALSGSQIYEFPANYRESNNYYFHALYRSGNNGIYCWYSIGSMTAQNMTVTIRYVKNE